MKRILSRLLIFVTIIFFGFLELKGDIVEAARISYGLIISNESGRYTYYDLNGVKDVPRIEKTSSGKVMVPVKKVSNYIPVLTYNYNWDTAKATIENKKTGKKIVITKGSQYIVMYANKKAKPKRVKLSAKTYLSKKSNALMADVNVFKYVFATTSGYKYFSNSNKVGKDAIQKALFDSSNIGGIIVYNPFQPVSSLPSAKAVSYVSEKDLSNTVKVTIPEGYSVTQIAKLLVSKGVCQSTSAFTKAVNSVKPSSYWFLNDVKKTSTRCFYLEGYLYPSTYEFYKNTSPSGVINKILNHTENQYIKEYEDRAKELGYTLDQVITIASIIEKEVSLEKEQPNVSSILYNRLDQKMKIQCDATINYVERYIKPYISGDMNRYNSYYNTYKCKGLPRGPICNPGKKALQAALHPNSTDYLYFCSDKNGTYYYARTYDEHLKNWEVIN